MRFMPHALIPAVSALSSSRRMRTKGKAIIGPMMSSSAMSHQDQTDSMGEGSERMMQQMMLDIPLGALVSYGRLTPEKLNALIETLNG